MVKIINIARTLMAVAMIAQATAAPAGNMDQMQQSQASQSRSKCTLLHQKMDRACASSYRRSECRQLRKQCQEQCDQQNQQSPVQGVIPPTTALAGNGTTDGQVGAGTGKDQGGKGDNTPFQCVQANVVVDFQGKEQVLVEGKVLQFDIALPATACKTKPATVTLKPAAGVSLSATSFSFNGANDKGKYTVLAKLNPATQVATGGDASVTLDWSYPSEPTCHQTAPQSIPLKVQKRDGRTAQALGDPHIRTFDGTTFDLMTPGVFKFVDNKNFQVQGAIRSCGGPGCVYGLAVQMGDTVARLVIEDRKIALAKGSANTNDLTIERQDGKPNNYRVFVVSDPATYIDINMNTFPGGDYLDVTARLSAGMLDDVQGVFGNGNGNPNDDEKDSQKLGAAFKVNGANLFTCGNGCADVKKPALESDKIKLDPVALLHQGYTTVSADQVSARSSTLQRRALASSTSSISSLHERRLAINEADVKALCTKVITGIPRCDKYVPDMDFYINTVCTQDTVELVTLDNIDKAKIKYLRECRREMDAAMALDAHATPQSKSEAKDDRANLALATTDDCPDNCNSRGQCVLNGCECSTGFSGLSCDITV